MEQVEQAADRELKKCRRLMRIAGKRLSDLQSPTISDMPSSPTYGNQVEDKVISQADAQVELAEIYRAITWLRTDEKDLITAKYFDPEEPDDKMVAYGLSMEERQYYRLKTKALHEFAEAFMCGSLFQNT